ncbi:MAG: CDP-archaeol synthase [Rhizobiaceae bacterium]
MPELLLRVLSAIVLLIAVMAVTWKGGVAFSLFWAAAAALILYEYATITGLFAKRALLGVCGLGLAAGLVIWFTHGPARAFDLVGAVIVGVVVIEAISSRRIWGAFGLLYAFLPFAALALLRGEDLNGLIAVCMVYGCVWGADTLAYFTGRALGGPKLAPAISPNKTWSGFFGGLMGSVLLMLAVLTLASLPIGIGAVVLAIMISIVSQIGDLVESWIKRRFKVKDSSHLIPGHGGVLDRIDGLIFGGVFAWVVGSLVSPVGGWFEPGASARGLLSAFVMP